MPPRTLASLAHSLTVAPDISAALVALGEGLADLDRGARIALIHYDARKDLLVERLSPDGERIARGRVDTTFDHLPPIVRRAITAGGQFADLADRSAEYARLLGMTPVIDDGLLALRGLVLDGALSAVLALYESRKIFGTRTAERFAPSVALFELGFARFAERAAREDAVRTLEDVTQRVHGEYVKKLSQLQQELGKARTSQAVQVDAERVVALERELARATEAARRAQRTATAVEHQVTAAVSQLEQAHVELHRRSESLRQKTRTLYLIERVLALDSQTDDPRQLVDGLLSLVGDDMQSQRVSLMLKAPEPDMLFLAAARGIAPHVSEGARMPIGEGVAGKVAARREPILVQDVEEAGSHPLLQDQYFTTGSFISFPLVYHGELLGVLNLTNRAKQGVFVDEDVERVRLLALVISLVVQNARLCDRLVDAIGVR